MYGRWRKRKRLAVNGIEVRGEMNDEEVEGE